MMSIKSRSLILPENAKRLLLHSCCAPCSSAIIEQLLESNITFAVLFYNPNIDTEQEYNKRKSEIVRFAIKSSVQLFDLDYDNSEWTERVIGLEKEPEKGRRCSICFSLRLETTAFFAKKNNFDIFTTSLGISRWKDFSQVCLCGHAAAKGHPGLTFWDCNWRKNIVNDRMEKISKQELFYRQLYCGCIYSKKKSF